MKRMGHLFRATGGAAAVEMAMVIPLMLILMMGSFELGNLFLDQHALTKQVRDGARYASRLTIDADYECPTTIFEDPEAQEKIINVTRTGAVEGAGNSRWGAYWDRTCAGEPASVQVSYRCVAKDTNEYAGIYTGLNGDIPVVTVSGAVRYRSVLSGIGFDGTNICIRSESEIPVFGL